MFRTTVALAALALASGAFAQSTSTTTDMGGGMTHVEIMGPNGEMKSSNCMNMGGNMTTCNTMDMNQPQRSYPTPDMSHPQTNGSTLSFIGSLIAQSRERSFQKKLSEMLAAGDCTGAANFADAKSHFDVSAQIRRSCQSRLSSNASREAGSALTAITPAPMSFVSTAPISFDGIDIYINTPLMRTGNLDTAYVVKFLGRKFTAFGPKGISTSEILNSFEQGFQENPWIYYTSDSTNTLHYTWNVNSIKIYSSGYEVWIRKYNNGYVNGKPMNKPSQTRVSHFINCRAQTIQTFDTVIYDDTGALTSSSEGSGTPSRIVPETVGSALYDEMCKLDPR